MLATTDDMWNPNAWDTTYGNHEFRIYGDNYANHWAIVDQEDYEWLIKDGHLWNVNWKKNHGRGPLKPYMRRAIGVNSQGVRLSTFTLYLHQAIVERMELVPPSEKHTMIDHRNGNSLDCRRPNLRWVTPSQNARNIYGTYSHELADW